jgi:preprotein translocase subunit SecG
MFAILLSLLILDALILSAVVLLQAGQGGGLASLGGATTDTVLGGRQAVTILTRLSWWCGGIFLGLALLLSLVPRNRTGSALQERIRATTPAAPSTSVPLPLGGEPAKTPAPQGQAAPAAPGTAPAAPAPAGGAPATKQPGK